MKISGGFVNFVSFACISRKLLRVIILGFILCLALNIAAQEHGATIFYLDGPSFALMIRGERTVIGAAEVNAGGVTLERGGIVHTGAGTFLEIMLVPSGAVIKISDNTSLVYNGMDSSGGFVDLTVLYGRIRVITGDGEGAGPVVIRSGGISSRVNAGDLGIDFILEPGDRNAIPRPVFRVHAFRGAAEVFPYGRGGLQPNFGGAQALSVGEGESLFLDISSSFTFAEKTPISAQIAEYWMINNFKGASPVTMPSTGIAIAPVPAEVPAPVIIYVTQPAEPAPAAASESAPASPPPPAQTATAVSYDPSYLPEADSYAPSRTSYNRKKTTGIIIGLAMTFAAAAVQGITYGAFDVQTNRNANTIFTAAHIPLGVGMLTTLGSILYNPSPGKK